MSTKDYYIRSYNLFHDTFLPQADVLIELEIAGLNISRETSDGTLSFHTPCYSVEINGAAAFALAEELVRFASGKPTLADEEDSHNPEDSMTNAHQPSPIASAQELEETLAVFREAMEKSQTRRQEARERMAATSPVLVRALRIRSGQSAKVSAIIWSVWNGHNQVGLCDALCSLDTDIADAVVSLIAARAHLNGDADDLIRDILTRSGEMARRELASQSEEVA